MEAYFKWSALRACLRGSIVIPWIVQLAFAINAIILLSTSSVAGPIGNVPCHRADATPCRNSTTCIHRSLMCDGQVDCPEGDDEDFMECQQREKITGHMNGILINESAVNASIDFHRKKTHECSLAEVPAECMCHHRRSLFCDGENLYAIPNGLPANEQISMLVLDNNEIRLSPPESGRNYNVKSLSLANNSIEEIPERFFTQFTGLLTLDLSVNNISTLEPGSLQGLSNLRELFLNNNRLRNVNLTVFADAPALVELELNSNELTLFEQSFPRLENLTHLVLSQNEIEIVNRDLLMHLNLTWLSLAKNRIREIAPNAFDSCTQLKALNLSSNNLEVLGAEVFAKLTNLQSLDLGKNRLMITDRLIFASLWKVEFLDIDRAVVPSINTDLFSHMRNLSIVRFSVFHYCSYVPKVKQCLPRSDGISSTENLLGRSYVRHMVWWIGTFCILGNTLVLCGRRFLGPEHQSVNIFVRNLAVGDLLTGIYLYLIGIEDIILKNQYNRYALVWRSSPLCGFAGMLALIAGQFSVLRSGRHDVHATHIRKVSLFTLVLMSIERCLAILFPFKHLSLTARKAWIIQVVTWTCAVGVSAAPAILWPTLEYYGSNAMCVPLHIQDPYSKGWQYSAFLYLGVNMVGSLIMVVCYTLMSWSIIRTRRSTPWPTMVDESRLFKRFVMIVLTDCFCWIPLIILKSISMAGYYIPDIVVTWFMVFVYPINAAINPILYTFSTSRFLGGLRTRTVPRPSIKYQPEEQRKVNLGDGEPDSMATSTTGTSRGQRSSNSSGAISGGSARTPQAGCIIRQNPTVSS